MSHSPRDLLVLEGEFPGFPHKLQSYVARGSFNLAALREQVRTAAPSSIVLLRAGEREGDVEAITSMIRDTPSVPIVAAVPFSRTTLVQVRALLDAGVAEIANADGEVNPAALLPALRQAHARPLKRRMEERMPVWVPEDARTLVRAAAEAVVDRGGRDSFAEIFGLYVRTMAARCTEAGLPPPRRLLGWIRVLLALSLLEETDRTVLNVAFVCGYTDNSSLKRAVENFTGSTVLNSIRDQTFAGGFDAFAQELRQLRHEGRRPRRGRASDPR